MTDLGELHVVKCFEELEDKYFSHDGWERYFLFALFFDEQIEAAGHILHNDGEVAILHEKICTYLTSLRKCSRILTILLCPIRASMPSYLFLYRRS